MFYAACLTISLLPNGCPQTQKHRSKKVGGEGARRPVSERRKERTSQAGSWPLRYTKVKSAGIDARVNSVERRL